MNNPDGPIDRAADQAPQPAATELGSGPSRDLRARAEQRLANAAPEPPLAPEDALRLVHELRVHQIELEMQNEELRRTQEALEGSRARYFDLYDLAPVGYLTIAEGGSILEANLTAARLLGVSRAELVGQRFSRFVCRDDQDTYYLGRAQRRPAYDLHLQQADGTTFWAHLETSVVQDAARGETLWRTTLSDITERRRGEAELERYRRHLEERVASRTAELVLARDAAEAANRAKSAFLANVSHEIRTPMNAILGFASLLGRTLADPQRRDRLAKIEQAAHRLLAIVDEVLEISRIEAGRLILAETDFDPMALLGQVRAQIGERLDAKGLAFAVEVCPLPQTLRGDPARLRQALSILLDNAVKFTDRGSVKLHVDVLESSATQLLLRFEVKDTGIGFDADLLPRIFNAFEQADVSMTRRHGGLGLGLAIARRLARLMGGDTGAESLPGQGSAFWLTARLGRSGGTVARTPDTLSTDSAAEGADRLRQRVAGARVLIVDDNEIGRLVVAELLGAAGLRTDGAIDGQAALDLARSHVYDLVLIDVTIPNLDVTRAVQEIRRLPGWERIPILALTASAGPEERERTLTAGMDDFVPKPVEPPLLYATLYRWLTAHR